MKKKQVIIALQASLLSICLSATQAYAAEGGSGTASITFIKELQSSSEPPPSPPSPSPPKRGSSSRDMQDKDIYNRGQGVSPNAGPDSGSSHIVRVLDPAAMDSLGNLPKTGGPNCL